jgi:hypothetical protein
MKNHKFQNANNKQIPKSNYQMKQTASVSRLEFDIRNLVFVWDFGFGAWDF